jgi:uncharacterized protein (TIGR03067 family)
MKPHALGLFAALALLAAGSPRERTAREDLVSLQGTWKVASLEADGAKAPIEQVQGMRLVIAGERFIVADSGTTTHGTLKLDPSLRPATIDLTFTDGPEQGKTSLGIYAIEGETAKLCLAVASKARPKAFATKAGSDCALEILVRAKK